MNFDWYKEGSYEHVRMACHSRAITSMSVDRNGVRMVTGSLDCSVKYWDFNGMDKTFQPFRVLEKPFEDYPAKDLLFGMQNHKILAISGSSHPTIYDRDGRLVLEFVSGDKYMADIRRTLGHVAAINGCEWDPHNENLFLTCSEDGTARVWDIEDAKKQKSILVVRSRLNKQFNKKISVSHASFLNNREVITASEDGVIRIWKYNNGNFGTNSKPEAEVLNVNREGVSIYHLDEGQFLSRSHSGIVMLWDQRKLSCPVASISLACCSIAVAPDKRNFIASTGTSDLPPNKSENSRIALVSIDTLSKVFEHPIDGCCTQVIWHKGLNQIFLGLSNGQLQILYNKTASERGIMLCLNKLFKRKRGEDEECGEIICPETHDLVQRSREGKGEGKILSRKESFTCDPPKHEDNTNEDPREALLKYAKIAEEQPRFITPAYKKTQPNPIFAKTNPKKTH